MDNLINLLIIVVGFVLVLASLALPRILGPARRRRSTQAAPRSIEKDRRALERVEEALVGLEETSRELFGRLDTRTRVLVRLIEDAEVRAIKLEELIERNKESNQ